jgi:ABC-type transport system involved in cytochrome c biogenesis permease subunit
MLREKKASGIVIQMYDAGTETRSSTGSFGERTIATLGGTALTLVLCALAIALLFFASLDEARYGLDIATRAYFGSLLAIWQYPEEWVFGSVLSRLWLPLPGGPVVAVGLIANLAVAAWRNRKACKRSFQHVSLLVIHAGLAVLIAGYGLLLTGSTLAKGVVMAGASICVAGLILLYAKAAVDYARDGTDRTTPLDDKGRARLSSHWLYAAALGGAAGAFLCSMNTRSDLITIFEEKRAELLPVLFYLSYLFALYLARMYESKREVLQKSLSAPLLSGGVAVHTLLVVMMVYIRRLPPAVDLYSSFVFAGWCGAMLASYVERRRRDNIAGIFAALAGTLALAVAFAIGNRFDAGLHPASVSLLWLSLHGAVMVFGLGAVLLSVIMANVLILWKRYGHEHEKQATLGRLMHGVFAAGFAGVALGTLMGGYWAETAWGRFWGWDPKENAALMLILWCAMALHSHKGGTVGEKGFAALVALSGLFLGWTWIGTNLMGTGLHTYGMTGTGAWTLTTYVTVQILIVIMTTWKRAK